MIKYISGSLDVRLQEIVEEIDRDPFEPFRIETAFGETIEITNPAQVLVPVEGPHLIVLFPCPDDPEHIIGVSERIIDVSNVVLLTN